MQGQTKGDRWKEWKHAIAVAASRVRADFAFAVVDVFVVVGSYTVALGVRSLDPLVTDLRPFWSDLFIAMPVIVLLHVASNVIAGTYGHVWEHASVSEAARIAVANVVAGSVILALALWARVSIGVLVPYLVVVVGASFSLFGMGLVRFRSRLFSFRKHPGASRVVILGDGREAALFARRSFFVEGGGDVIGFISDHGDQGATVRRLAGLPVLGGRDQIARIVEEYAVDEIVVIGNDPARSRAVVDSCLSVNVRLRIAPLAAEVLLDSHAPLDVRDIRVEDLLARSEVETDLSPVAKLIEGRRVLITGAGGSIGSEAVSQVFKFDPAEVIVLDRDETLLHDASLRWSGTPTVVLGDIREAAALLRTFGRYRPEVVIHAAALKHVPVLENHPAEAVLTNVVGTRNVIEAGSRNGMEHFVLISTDKAVDPASIMGATKRVAEMLVESGAQRRDGCIYTAVRFGNVLGSRGSVIPTFIKQIQAGGPLTVTHSEMMRYFMTVDEAVQLVLQAAALADGSEIFLLDMGEPVRIEAMGRRLIRLAGLTPDHDIEIHYTGVRPGEKLLEVLADGPVKETGNPKISEVRHAHTPLGSSLIRAIGELEDAAIAGDGQRVVTQLKRLSEGHLESAESVEEQMTLSWS